MPMNVLHFHISVTDALPLSSMAISIDILFIEFASTFGNRLSKISEKIVSKKILIVFFIKNPPFYKIYFCKI